MRTCALEAAESRAREDGVEAEVVDLRSLRPLDTDTRVAWLLLLSTVPAAAIGAVFEDTIDERLGTPTIIAICRRWSAWWDIRRRPCWPWCF